MLPFCLQNFLKGDETMDFWKRAQELKDEIIQNRRRIHQNAEVGLNLPNTKAFVTEKLREYGDRKSVV